MSDLVGGYICFRPALTAAGVISAYLIDVHWDKETSCLTFDEKDRKDAAHAQRGRVYIPDGRQFMSLVTVEGGSIRLVTVYGKTAPQTDGHDRCYCWYARQARNVPVDH